LFPESLAVRLALALSLGFGLAMLAVVVVLARRNLRQGRGDRRGALRLATFLLLAIAFALALRADHTAAIGDEVILSMNVFMQAVAFAVLTALYYLAFEPVARRAWPRLLIAWTRLLDGRWRDPLVGRDVLLGMLAGVAMAGVVHLATVVPSGLGHERLPPLAQVSSTLNGLRHVAYFALYFTYIAIGFPIFACLGLYLVRALVRWTPLAHGLMYAFFVLTLAVSTVYVPPTAPAMLLYAAFWYATCTRLGWLAAGVALFVATFLQTLPLTLDTELWYADRTWLGLGFLLAVAALAFRNALGGKPMLPMAWLGK
jgi:serine/threonine-protein kinase